MPPDNAVVFKRKLSDALIRSLTEPAKIEPQRLNEVRTFEYVAKQWLAFKSAEWVTKSISGFSAALNKHILPAIGKKPSARSSWSTSPRSLPRWGLMLP